MTFKEICECEKDVLKPADIAQVLGCDPYTINVYAKKCPERLGFPVLMIGSRVKIPKQGFIAFWTGKMKMEAGA